MIFDDNQNKAVIKWWFFKKLKNQSVRVGLIVKQQEIKNLRFKRNTGLKDSKYLEKIKPRKYLGSTLNRWNCIAEEMKGRITSGNKDYYAINKYLKAN